MTSRARKWLIISSLAAVLLLVLIAIFSDNHSEVEVLKAQLRAKGEKISFIELGMTNAHKAEYIQPLEDMEKRFRSSVIQPAEFNLMRMVTPQTTEVAWQSDLLPSTGNTNNPSRTWADFSEEFDSFKDDFTFLHSLLENPPANQGHDFRDIGNWPKSPFVAQRTAANWLMGATLHELHFDRRETALKNLHALLSLVHFHRNDCYLVNQMIRVAIGEIGLSATWQALQADGWTEVELQRLQTAWANIQFPGMLEKGLLGERAIVDAAFALAKTNRAAFLKVLRMSSGSWQDILSSAGVSLWHMSSSHKDEMLSFSTSQKSLELCRQIGSRPWPALQKEIDAGINDFEAYLGSFGRYQYWLSSMILPNSRSAHLSTLRNETGRQLLLTAIALKRHQLRHGRLPSDLSFLSPEFLPSIPIDPMSCQPLRYKLSADGNFTLYSVGADGKDNGGSARPDFDRGKYRAKLWLEGDDIVWPQPATAEELTKKEVETTDEHR